jgi:hypothetical protein
MGQVAEELRKSYSLHYNIRLITSNQSNSGLKLMLEFGEVDWIQQVQGRAKYCSSVKLERYRQVSQT